MIFLRVYLCFVFFRRVLLYLSTSSTTNQCARADYAIQTKYKLCGHKTIPSKRY